MTPTLEDLRPCLEGVVPSKLSTCSPDGTPNTALVSQVDYVDSEHVATSFQFFNKTRQNILANPHASAIVIHPATGQITELILRYLHTETEGQIFERMKARLAGIASHTGMSEVFRLQGADIYHVESIRVIPGKTLAEPLVPKALAPAMRLASSRMAAASDLASLLETTLEALESDFGISHSMILMWDASSEKLITLASHGYTISGVGSEIAPGEGVIGVAAAQRTPIRITHMTSEYSYGKAIRENALECGLEHQVSEEIPFPGLPRPGSQLAVPVIASGRLMGVLHVESVEENRFSYDHEDVLVMLSTQLALSMALLAQAPDGPVQLPAPAATAPGDRVVTIRRYGCNDSIFLDQAYLIKGVAGAIFWRLVQEFSQTGRTEFSNRELRLDSSLRLPDIDDNLEARLILLARRLEERNSLITLEKTGRGRFRLAVSCRIRLQDTD